MPTKATRPDVRLAPKDSLRAVRRNSAGAVSRSRIINAAECLFADRGIDAVSFKEIGSAVGLSNNSAAQYYFGDKKGVVEAILEVRFSQLEARRSEMLAALLAQGRETDVHALLEAIFRPRAELIDDRGFNTFSQFMLEFRIRCINLSGVRHPIEREWSQTTSSAQIANLLRATLPILPVAEFEFRLQALSNMLDAALVERDTQTKRMKDAPSRNCVLDRSLRMACAALQAPATDGACQTRE